MKKVSFVIPAYNCKVLLKNSLETLNRQTGFNCEDYEVIVVDDGSDDDTYEYIKGTNRNYDLKYYYLERCTDSCRSRARNAGIGKAEGEIIAFIDADIMVPENYVGEILSRYSLYDDIILIGNRIFLEEDISYELVYDRERFNQYISDIKILNRENSFVYYKFSYNINCYDYPWMQAFTCNMTVPKRYIERIGGFDEGFKGWGMEDNDFAYRLSREGAKIIFNSKMRVFHQRHMALENTDEVKKIRTEEHRRNLSYFLEKFPEAFSINREEAIQRILGTSERTNTHKNTKNKIKKVIDYKAKEELENVKEQVLNLSEDTRYKIAIYDYVEDSDLDIWVQYLGARNSTPKYYPMSQLQEIQAGFSK